MTDGKELQTKEEYSIEPDAPNLEVEMERWRIQIGELMPLIISYQLCPTVETRDQIVQLFDEVIITERRVQRAYDPSRPAVE